MRRRLSADLLTAGGTELTTYYGHAVILGAHQWIDWRIRPGNGDMQAIAAAAYAAGQVYIIAHPLSDGEPGCTGCSWRFGEMMPGNARLVEIWNGPWDDSSHNDQSLAMWYDWLNQGMHLAATAGTDAHGEHSHGPNPAFNVIYAEALTEAALLKGLMAGHLYLTAGPELSFAAAPLAGRPG